MSDAASLPSSESDLEMALDAEVDEAISLCGGDVRAALRATMLANAYLEAEVDRLSEAVSAGFARGRIRRRVRPEDGENKVG